MRGDSTRAEMRRQDWARRTVGLALLAAAGWSAGCAATQKEPAVTYLGKASLSYYKGEAERIDYPVGVEGDPSVALSGGEPRTITDRRRDEVWDVTLTEALHTALVGNKIIRMRSQNRGRIVGEGLLTTSLTAADSVNSIYDPAIQESGVLFGGRGVEAALADFDAQLTSSMVWGRNEQYVNSAFGGAIGGGGGAPGTLTPGTVAVSETGAFQSALTKATVTGGQIQAYHNWNYLGTNQNSVLFPTAYTGNVGVSFTQPLLAGAGAEYTRIAGPRNPNFGAITGVNQGVVIARINNDITLANFEIAVRNLMKDVEDAYWNLYFSYRQYDTALTARNSALRGWREAKAKLEIGGVANFKPADEAQARDRYFETRAQVESALNNIYLSEAELRRLLALPPADGRVMRPVEEPTTAKLEPDWHTSLCEALLHRAELRRQKWSIKSLELQLVAARSLTRPTLNFVSGYQVNGFGDDLLAGSNEDGVTANDLDSAYGQLLRGDTTAWNLGVQLNMPLGFRQARTQVRNIELRLAKARETLAAAELDVSHEVADAVQAIEFQYQNAQTNFNRRTAAARRTELFEEELQAGTVTLDEVLRAQSSLATAENSYFQSLVNYNQAIAYLHFVKGTLLERDGVTLEEGAWTPKAYEQALRRAWERSHAFDNPILHDDPEPFAIPDDSRHLVTAPVAASASGGAVPPAPTPAEASTEGAPAATPLRPLPPIVPPTEPALSPSAAARLPAGLTPDNEFSLPIRVPTPTSDRYRDFAAGSARPASPAPTAAGRSTVTVLPSSYEEPTVEPPRPERDWSSR